MTFAYNPWAVPEFLGAAASFAMAAFVYLAAPRSLQPRALALFLAAVGILRFGVGLTRSATSVDSFNGAAGITFVTWIAAIFWGLLFLSTMESRLSRPLRARPVRILLGAGGLIAPLAFFWDRSFFNPGAILSPFGALALAYSPGFNILGLVTIAFAVYGLTVALTAFREAPLGTLMRTRAGAFALAFGVFSGYWLIPFLDILFLVPNVWGGPSGRPFLWAAFLVVANGLIEVVFAILLSYAFLKTQLFDIDLKLKWTVKQSTVAAAFIAAFFIASELAQVFFTGSGLGPYVGVVATGLLVFAIAPIQRAAEAVASKALPSVSNAPDYLSYRKLQVYRAAFEGVVVDGNITEKERAMLVRLREELTLRPDDADAVETDVRQRFAMYGTGRVKSPT